MELQFKIKKAVRHAVPQIISIAGVSGSGKTYSALLIAAGMAGPKGKVGFLDTENGRGSMYADAPGIMKALPNGYDTIEMSAPFHPRNYIEAINTFENEGYSVLVIDSGSHYWEGEGGCTDIAEKDKGRWNNAKLWNKRLINRLLGSNMHIIVCLRAREKTKLVKVGGKEETINLGILPVCEKNFTFEMLIAFMVDEGTHHAHATKVPEGLENLLSTPRLLTMEDGIRISEWNNTGMLADPLDRLKKRAQAAASNGLSSYEEFFKSITPAQRQQLKDLHADYKRNAIEADQQNAQMDQEFSDAIEPAA